MSLRNFDTELDLQGVSRMVTTVTSTVTVKAAGKKSEVSTYTMKPDDEWTWQDLRDFVVNEIEQRFGVVPDRDFRKERGIFSSFLGRWGAQAVPIARHVFEVRDGFWQGKQVDLYRFCKNSDPYFSDLIAERFVSEPVHSW